MTARLRCGFEGRSATNPSWAQRSKLVERAAQAGILALDPFDA
jgi:hypothetical protein